MPIDGDRSGLRLGLGAATVFVAGMALGWPLPVVGAVFTGMFLQGKKPLPVGAGVILGTLGFGLMASALLVFSALSPYAVPFVIVVTLAVAACFLWAVRGGGMLQVVLALMAALMIPFLVLSSVELAALLVVWIPVNIVFAVLAAQFWFAVLPDRPSEDLVGEEAVEVPQTANFDEGRRLVRMTIVTLPFASAFFVFESGALLTLLFVAILTQQLAASTSTGGKVASGMILANVVGGLLAVVAYELVVVAPFFRSWRWLLSPCACFWACGFLPVARMPRSPDRR